MDNKIRTDSYTAYKRSTLGQKTWTDWKCGDGKGISCKWKWQENDSNIQKKTILKQKSRQRTLMTKGLLNIRAPKHIKYCTNRHKKRNSWEHNNSRDFTTLVTSMGRFFTLKTNKPTETLNDRIVRLNSYL